jgi:leucyl-tRNA synthetase
MLGHDKSLLTIPWPTYRKDALKEDTILVVLQVNGKVRSRIEVPANCSQKEIETKALADERVQRFVNGNPVKKVIVVKNKLVNVVV